MYPIWIRDGKTTRPKAPKYYIIAANGNFLRKEMPFWNTTVPVDRISMLEEETSSLELLLPPLGKDIVEAAARFFAWVYRAHGAEAVIALTIDEKTKEYTLYATPQEVGHGTIPWYDLLRLPKGKMLVGTFHSHGSIPAFHSGIDTCDERGINGIHATFGRFDLKKNSFEISVQAAINGTRFPLEPLEWLKGIVPYADRPLKEEPVADEAVVEEAAVEEAAVPQDPESEGALTVSDQPEQGLFQEIDGKRANPVFSPERNALSSVWHGCRSFVDLMLWGRNGSKRSREERDAGIPEIPIVKNELAAQYERERGERGESAFSRIFGQAGGADKHTFILEGWQDLLPEGYAPPDDWIKNLRPKKSWIPQFVFPPQKSKSSEEGVKSPQEEGEKEEKGEKKDEKEADESLKAERPPGGSL